MTQAERRLPSPNTTPGEEMLSLDALKTVLSTEREGLPPGYRMRADRHYVEQLTDPVAAIPIRMVPLGQIHFDGLPLQDDLQPLTESIRVHGVVQPLLVRRQVGRYGVVAGRKRLA